LTDFSNAIIIFFFVAFLPQKWQLTVILLPLMRSLTNGSHLYLCFKRDLKNVSDVTVMIKK